MLTIATRDTASEANDVAIQLRKEGIDCDITFMEPSGLEKAMADIEGREAKGNWGVFITGDSDNPEDRRRWEDALITYERGCTLINVVTGETVREGRW